MQRLVAAFNPPAAVSSSWTAAEQQHLALLAKAAETANLVFRSKNGGKRAELDALTTSVPAPVAASLLQAAHQRFAPVRELRSAAEAHYARAMSNPAALLDALVLMEQAFSLVKAWPDSETSLVLVSFASSIDSTCRRLLSAGVGQRGALRTRTGELGKALFEACTRRLQDGALACLEWVIKG
jgi:hypothetical protein